MCGTEIEARRALERAIAAAGPHGEGWWVLNTIPLRGDSNSDADLLVGVPRSGILIIEVKGWTTFTVDDRGHWSRPGRRGAIESAGMGPFDQAHRQEYLLLESIVRYRGEGGLASGDLPRIGSGVLFGNLTSIEIDSSQWANDLRFTLFRDTFCPTQDLSEEQAVGVLNNVRAILGAGVDPERRTDNSAPRLDAIKDLLAPTRRITGLAAFVDDSHRRLNQLAETAMDAKAEMLEAGSVYVEGPAGTGKTILALRLGLQRSRASGRPSLYICFSERLAQEIREVEQVGDGRVEVFTPEELLTAMAGPDAMQPFREQEEASARAAQEVAELLGVEPEVGDRRAYLGAEEFWEAVVSAVASSGVEYASVVVDEAQDLWEPAFTYLSSLVGPDGLFGVFVDPHQTTRRERAGLVWSQPASTLNGRSVQLRRNLRNGDRIIDAVEERFTIGYELPPRGPLPAELELVRYSNADPMVRVVSDRLAELQVAGLEPVVLVTGISLETQRELEAAGLEVNVVDSFKGLERKAVILVLGQDTSPVDPNDEDLYVGMTRATVLLSLVFHVSQSPLSPEDL
jgi:hypothetical protein